MKKSKLRGATKYLGGYTIVEVVIFLAASGALLVASATLINGRQERIRFSQSIVSLEQQLQDTFNDASTGYFPSNSDFSCTSTPTGGRSGGPRVRLDFAGDTDQGTNSGCVFVGKLIHFHAETHIGGGSYRLVNTNYNIYTVVGSRYAQDITDGDFYILGYSNEQTGGAGRQTPGIAERETMGADIQFQRVGGWGVRDFTTPNTFHSILVVSDFNSGGAFNSGPGNAARVKLYGYNNWSRDGYIYNDELIPIDEALAICMAQDGNGREAALVVTKQLSLDRQIDKQPEACD